MSENTTVAAPGGPVDALTDAPQADALPETAEGDTEPKTYDQEYVTGLREEAKSWRLKAGRADDLEARLHSELTKSDGRLADPADLPFDAEHLADPQKHADAITELLKAKPHFASRIPIPGSSIGQGQQGSPTPPKASLIDAIRSQQGH
jgi:hypothetical protein